MDNPAERLKRLRRDPNWRARAGEVARRAMEDAQRRNERVETAGEKLAEAERMQALQAGLPVSWQDGAGKTHLRGAPLVQSASAGQIENYAQAPSRTCGMCKHFNLREGQKAMVQQRFAERLVLEEEWQLHHTGAPLDHMGVCDASGGTMATSTVAKADTCAQFTPKGRIFR